MCLHNKGRMLSKLSAERPHMPSPHEKVFTPQQIRTVWLRTLDIALLKELCHFCKCDRVMKSILHGTSFLVAVLDVLREPLPVRNHLA